MGYFSEQLSSSILVEKISGSIIMENNENENNLHPSPIRLRKADTKQGGSDNSAGEENKFAEDINHDTNLHDTWQEKPGEGHRPCNQIQYGEDKKPDTQQGG
ncbi:hypothetical protein [Tolypothrix sp. VBCCA 56010]|uniref:hypothetical protein n=1 Tax=Tolypothrix sp. VBCCA 56010 TaxID=3137731 RepID=UPI003D7F170B